VVIAKKSQVLLRKKRKYSVIFYRNGANLALFVWADVTFDEKLVFDKK